MPKRAKLLADLQAENAYGVLLMVQMDGVPETLQLVLVTGVIDETIGGLRERGRYVIRALGVREHRLSVGMFGSLRLLDAHPLLDQYNTTPVGLFFRGQAADPNALLVDVLQAYAGVFGPWRQIPTYLNASKPLFSLLAGAGDLVGEMPKPLADALAGALEKHGLETRQIAGEGVEAADEHGRSQHMRALIIDESYIVALDFTVDELGKIS
jgi:hypothetical protein